MKLKIDVFRILFIVVLVGLLVVAGCNNETGNVIQDVNDADNESEIVNEEASSMQEFNACLAENGLIIYGASWCPHCTTVVNTLGGYDVVGDVYVECTENQQRCSEEMFGGGVPELQFNGEVYRGARTLDAFSELTGCGLPV
jgi:glutaredoxin